MRDEIRQAETIVDRIRQLLLNYDLTLAYAKGEIAIREAEMKLYEGKKGKASNSKFITAKIDKERYEIFISDVEVAKAEIMDNINIILSKYQDKYKAIFNAYFFQNKSYQEIANETNYSFDTINKIIRKLRVDLITFYIP